MDAMDIDTEGGSVPAPNMPMEGNGHGENGADNRGQDTSVHRSLIFNEKSSFPSDNPEGKKCFLITANCLLNCLFRLDHSKEWSLSVYCVQ